LIEKRKTEMTTQGFEINQRVPAFEEGVHALRGLATSIVSDVLGRTIGAVGLVPMNRESVTACGNAVTVSVRAGDNLMIHKAQLPAFSMLQFEMSMPSRKVAFLAGHAV
jgi:hypothetical protein